MFGIGASKSKSTSQSTSDSLSYGSSNSTSSSVSGGSSLQGSNNTSRQNIAFEDVFAKLYGDAMGAAGGIDPSMLTEQANGLFSSGSQFLDMLGGGADTAYLQERVSGGHSMLGEQIGGLKEDLGSFFRDELNPAITSKHVAGGTLGGGRQGVAQGKAMDTVSRDFTRGVTDLRARDIAARDAAATTLGQQRIAGASAGVSALPGLGAIAEQGANAGLDPYLRLLQSIGGPMALTSSDGSSFGTSEDFARALSEAVSSDYSTSTSQSTSKAKSASFNFGFGGGG